MPQRRGRAAALAALLGLTAAASLEAGPPVYQVKDIVPGPAASGPDYLTAAVAVFDTAPKLIFTAATPTFGSEIWRTDGTSAGTVMVKDISPGADGSFPSGYLRTGLFSTTVFFGAGDGVHGYELWRSDGTLGGTAMVKDINPDSSGGPHEMTVVPSGLFSSTLIYSADDGSHGVELWKSDGTADGTVLVEDIEPGFHSFPARFVNVGGTVFFAASTTANGRELWKTNGTAAGTVLVKDIFPGSQGSQPASLTAVGDRLYFVADNGIHGEELWTSDGTTNGTFMVKDLDPASSHPESLTAWNGVLYFSAEMQGVGRELFKSDGTLAGTDLLRDVSPGAADGTPESLTPSGAFLFFRADDGVHGAELWKTDGTTAGTVLVKDVNPGAASSLLAAVTPRTLASLKGTLFFTADDGVSGAELWRSDGREGGTFRIRDVAPGPAGSRPILLTAAGSLLYFNGNDGATGHELWAADFIFGNGFEP